MEPQEAGVVTATTPAAHPAKHFEPFLACYNYSRYKKRRLLHSAAGVFFLSSVCEKLTSQVLPESNLALAAAYAGTIIAGNQKLFPSDVQRELCSMRPWAYHVYITLERTGIRYARTGKIQWWFIHHAS